MAGNVIVKMLPFKDPRSKDRGSSNAAHIDYIGHRPGTDKSITDDSLQKMASLSALYSMSADEKYISYIGQRPGAVRGGVHRVHPVDDHGLFGEYGVPDLTSIQQEVRKLKNSPMYRLIISLTDTTAADLGYTTKESWEAMIRNQVPMLANNMMIPAQRLMWVAALHLKDGHPHVHLTMWDREDRKRFKGLNVLPKENLSAIRTEFTKTIYAERRLELYSVKNASREYITGMLKTDINQVKALFNEKEKQVSTDQSMPAPTEAMLNQLSSDITALSIIMPGSGRTSYDFMPPEVKTKVNEIIEKILSNPAYVEQLSKIQKFAAELAEQFGKNPDKIKVAINNATGDIRKRMSQIVLKAAAELNKENAKALILYSLYEYTKKWKFKQLDLKPADSVFYIQQIAACGVDPQVAKMSLPHLLSMQSINYAYDFFKVNREDGLSPLLEKVYDLKPRIRPAELKEFWKRVDNKADLVELYKDHMERRIINTVSMGVLRSIFNLFNRQKSQKKLNSFFIKENRPKRFRDSLYTKDELE